MPTDQQTFQDAKTAGDAAAMWWVSVIHNPQLDSGDSSSIMGALVARSKAVVRHQTTDSLERFKAILAKRLNQLLGEEDEGREFDKYGISLSVDYYPEDRLLECAEEAGLRCDRTDWPWRTTMKVKPHEVSVRHGYHAEREVIWTKAVLT